MTPTGPLAKIHPNRPDRRQPTLEHTQHTDAGRNAPQPADTRESRPSLGSVPDAGRTVVR
jgi:hypothetical protein